MKLSYKQDSTYAGAIKKLGKLGRVRVGFFFFFLSV